MELKYLVIWIALLSVVVFANTVSVVMYPNSHTFVTRTYDLDTYGIFTLEPTEIKNVDLSDMSVLGKDAVVYSMRDFEVNRTTTVLKNMEELLNESKGSKIKVTTPSGAEVEGTLIWYDGERVGLNTGDSLQVFSLGELLSIKLPALATEKTKNYTEHVISILGSASGQSPKVVLGYVKNDLSWDIDYDLYVNNKNAVLKQYANIINSGPESYENAKLTLTLANPNFVAKYYPIYRNDYAKSMKPLMAGAPSTEEAPSFSTSLSKGVWSYSASVPITIPPSSVQKFEVFSDNVEYVMKYVWETYKGDDVYRVYNITNGRKEVLPAGVVRVFENEVFRGEDRIDMLPSGSSTELFVSDAPQFTVSKKIISDKVSGSVIENRYIHMVNMKLYVKNSGTSTEEVEIREGITQYTDYEFVSSNIAPKSVNADKIIWVVNIEPGSERTIEYVYKYSTSWG
ncbi:MAG: DUF4139 domain-containing protein [Candidatus Micrarchaeia archaeon]